MNVCFTGHRRIQITPELECTLIQALEDVIEKGAVNFYAGGAYGWDQFCSDKVISLKNKYPNIKLHLILPCPNNEQTVKWNEKDKENFTQIFSSADGVEYTSKRYTKNCMKVRNARLIELADHCICYYSGKYISGTGQTIRMAESKGISIVNLYASLCMETPFTPSSISEQNLVETSLLGKPFTSIP